MTIWAQRYLETMSQRDLACLALAVCGLLLFINTIVFIRPNRLPLPELARYTPWWWTIMLGALAVRVAFIWVPAPWYDEAFTILLARLDFANLLSGTAGDVHPPLYYMLIAGFSDNILKLRLYSVAASMLSLWVFWVLTDDLYLTPAARLVALACMAFMPTQIYYGQEARMYAVLQLLVLFQFMHMYHRAYTRLAITSILVLYLHNYGLYYCAVIYGLAFWREWHHHRNDNERIPARWPAILISGAVAFAAFIPWLVVLLGQMGRLEAGYWIQPPTPGSVLYDLLQIVYGVYMPDLAAIPAGISLGAILAAMIYYGLVRRRYTELAMIFGPLALALITGLFYRPVLLFRALLPALPFMAVLAAIAITSEWRAWIWAIPAGATLVLGCGWLIYMNSTGESHPQNIMLSPAESSSPRVVHLNDATLLGYLLYRPDQHHYLLQDDDCSMDGALSDQTRQALGIQYITEDQLMPGDEIAMIVGPLAHPCMVETYHRLADTSTPVKTLDKTYWVEGVWRYAGP